MKYSGKLYGKVGKTYIPLVLTSDEVDAMEAEVKRYREALERIDALADGEDPWATLEAMEAIAHNALIPQNDESSRSAGAQD